MKMRPTIPAEQPTPTRFLGCCILAIVTLLVIFPAQGQAQQNITVAQDGSGDFTTIQAALNSIDPATLDPSITTIVVKPGVYAEQIIIPQFCINPDGLPPLVSIEGCDPTDREIVESTVIDCSIGPLTHSTDPGKENVTLIVRGLKFTNGSLGAAQIFGANASFCANIFCENFSAFLGGAAIFQSGGELEVEGNEFANNQTSGSGAAIFFEGDGADLDVNGNTFENNGANGAGAVRLGGSTVANVMGNVFVGNTSTNNAGAIAIEDNVVPLLVSNFFIDNTGANGSGALDISNQGGGEGSSNFTGPQPQGIVSDCVFDSNQEGCVRIEGNGPRFVNCVFRNNTSAAAGGAMLIIPNSSVQLFNCVFDGNQSDDFGGAILNFDASLEMINCTMVHNTAELGGDSFAATADANTSVVNSIIWDNGSPMGITEGGDGSFSLEFSIVEGGFPGTGNIDQDPQFVDEFGPDGLAGTGDEDLSLQSTSPAIDAGDNLAVLLDDFDADEDEDFTERFPFDLLLNARFVDHPEVADTGNGLSPIVDMGAIEFQVATKVLLGDVNLDGVVDLLDVESFVDRITNGVFQAEADVNQDGMVNLLDVGPFISILSNA